MYKLLLGLVVLAACHRASDEPQTLPIRPSDAGLTSDKGFAVFMVDPDNLVYVVPVADRP